MLLEILKYPDPRLKNIAQPVGEITPQIRELAENMLETMYHARGVGLAAPQIGQSLRMLVMDEKAGEEEKNPRVIINPELEFLGEIITSPKEGCLSVPLEYRADVKRYEQVRIKALDLDGNTIDEVWSGFPAIIVQHETDHLDGKLFIDRISFLKRTIYDNKIKKLLKSKNNESNLI